MATWQSGTGQIDFEKELNDEQFQAVTARPGPALVLAGAGSGKTRTLTYRVAYLLSQGVHPGSILLLTFTNKAAREMLSRVEDLTCGRGGLYWGGTFHRIGARILRRDGYRIGVKPEFTILDQSDAETLFKQCIQRTDLDYLKSKEYPKPKVLLSLYSYARNTRVPVDVVLKDRYPWIENAYDCILGFFNIYQQTKLEQQVLDYDDLLIYWLKLLQDEPSLAKFYQNQFQHVLVDEYQDTNLLQCEIIDLMGAHHNIMAVGDDAQCIYTWRGANFENIMSFPDRHPDTRIYKIQKNYRSSPEILSFANQVLASQVTVAGYDKKLEAVRPHNVKPYVVPQLDPKGQARFLITRIRGLMDEGYQAGDIAILYRAHYQALDLQLEFTRQKIPFVITSGLKFFEQAHVKDVVAMVKFLANPNDSQAFIRFATLLPKVGEKTALRLLAQMQEFYNKQKRPTSETGEMDLLLSQGESVFQVVTFCALMKNDVIVKKVPAAAREEWQDMASSLIEVSEKMQSAEGCEPRDAVRILIEGWYGDYLVSAYTNWQERQDDLLSMMAFAEQFEEFSEFLAQLILVSSESSDKSVDVRDDMIRMTTIHQAKGLEFPVVFVVGLADGLFPLKRSIEDGDLSEERRLFYVAITRAMDELYLTYPSVVSQGKFGTQRVYPSRFIEEIPRNYYELLRSRSNYF